MVGISPARRDVIGSRLAAGQAVSSGALAAEFDISEDAIRRDLRALAASGVCRRVYGGALPMHPAPTPIAERLDKNVRSKQALARFAIDLIDPGTFIFLDNGSTNVMAAKLLPPELNFTAATNSIALAATLTARADVPFMMVGGTVDASVGGCIDAIALEALSRLNVDTCLLGVCSLSVEGGVSAFDAADASFKRALAARSGRVVLLATNDKLGTKASHWVASVDAIDVIIVEHDASDDVVCNLKAAGATVLRAGLPEPQQAGEL